MISASNYQHIRYFMSLLKVSLCINRPRQRPLCIDARRGCGSNRLPTPWKNKNIFFHYFFSKWGPFCYIFLLMRGVLSFEGLFATFSLRVFFCYVFHLMWGFFHHVGAFLLLFTSCERAFLFVWGIFCLHGAFFDFIGFFMGWHTPPSIIFCERILLCSLHPMSSAITYSSHFVPNKAHCNTRVQFTIAIK